METGLIFLGVPILVACVIAMLPTGPVALGGLLLGVAASFAAPVVIGDDGAGFAPLLSGILAMAVSVAGLVQLSRHQRRGAGAATLAVIVGCLGVLAAQAIWKILQV